jgi:hypothetical protein
MNFVENLSLDFYRVREFLIVFFEPLLTNLDPSLFQNIVLGIIAIFIPFGIVLLTDILNLKSKNKYFKQQLLNSEVLEVQKLFWITVFSLTVFSFISNDSIDFYKLVSVIILIIIIYLFYITYSVPVKLE